MAEVYPQDTPPAFSPTPGIQPLSPSDERTWAMLAHLSVLINLVTGLLGPVVALIIYLVYKDRSRFVAYHALQSLLSQLIWWVGGGIIAAALWTIGGILTVICIGILIFPLALVASLLPIYALVAGIIGAIQTSQGADFRYWLIGDWVRDTLVSG
jgi:uncharacterized protein